MPAPPCQRGGRPRRTCGPWLWATVFRTRGVGGTAQGIRSGADVGVDGAS